jgi:hypothetical protein
MSRADVREGTDKGRFEMGTKNDRAQKRGMRFTIATILVALTITFVAGVVPAGVAAQAATDIPVFRSQLTTDSTVGKLAVAEASLAMAVAPHTRTATVIQPVAAPRPTARRTSTGNGSSTGSSSGSAAPAATGGETGQAQSILAGYIAKHPILAGTSVSMGDAKGSQAIAYYKSGRIVISPSHTASLQRIISHEIWHIIDWRDNGVIDWGENVPPQ